MSASERNGELTAKRMGCLVADAALAIPSSPVSGRRDCAPIMVSKRAFLSVSYQLFMTPRATPSHHFDPTKDDDSRSGVGSRPVFHRISINPINF